MSIRSSVILNLRTIFTIKSNTVIRKDPLYWNNSSVSDICRLNIVRNVNFTYFLRYDFGVQANCVDML